MREPSPQRYARTIYIEDRDAFLKSIPIACETVREKERLWARKRRMTEADFERILEIAKESDRVITCSELAAAGFRDGEKVVAMRHDVDWDLLNAVRFAEMEASHGIRSTYFMLHSAWYFWAEPGRLSRQLVGACDRIRSLGHEIAIHNDSIATALLEGRDPKDVLTEAVESLRDAGFEILGSASHGNPLCRKLKFNNYEIFKDRVRDDMGSFRRIEYECPEGNGKTVVDVGQAHDEDFGLQYEAYFIPRKYYLSDTGGRWSRPVDEIRRQFSEKGGALCVLIHPDWWDLNGGYIEFF